MQKIIHYLLQTGKICLLVLNGLLVSAQDIQFSQFYAVGPFQNPAFAGSEHRNRMILHQRLQWPALEASYLTSLASVDTYVRQYNSGLGLMVLHDIQGRGNISSTEVQLQYAYEWHINSQLSARGGLQVGYVNRTVDYSRFIFSSQFDDDGFVSGPNPANFGDERLHYADVSAGGVLYTNNIWFGYSAHHMNQPNQSMLNGSSQLPVIHAFTGGYKYVLKADRRGLLHGQAMETAIIPTFHYKFQGKSDQFDIGVYGIHRQFMAGLWYRGIPIKRFERDLHNNEAIIILAGFRISDILQFHYSYDFTISRLAPAGTGGSHEFNLTLFWPPGGKRSKPSKRLPCPRFSH